MNSSDNYQWAASPIRHTKNFVCNKPNEFCYDDKWTQLSESAGNVSFNGCGASSEDNGVAVISQKKWTNDNLPIKIEYTFKVNNVLNTSWNDVGITMHIYDSSDANVCEYTFFGIAIEGDQVYNKTGVKWHDGEDQPHTMQPMITGDFNGFSFEYDRYYTLLMEIYSSCAPRKDVGELMMNMSFDDKFVTKTTIMPDLSLYDDVNILVSGTQICQSLLNHCIYQVLLNLSMIAIYSINAMDPQ